MQTNTGRMLDTIGELRVTDELGNEHVVTIRREDLATTNGAYRAIRDTVTDTLRTVLETNRGAGLRSRPFEDAALREAVTA